MEGVWHVLVTIGLRTDWHRSLGLAGPTALERKDAVKAQVPAVVFVQEYKQGVSPPCPSLYFTEEWEKWVT